MDPNDRQVAGTHYHNGGEQHWDRVQRLGLDYMQAQITKYVERAWKKNGLEDLEKAHHFLEKYIAQIKERNDRYQRKLNKAAGLDDHGPAVAEAIRRHEELVNSINPEYAPLYSFPKGRVKPTGWIGFVFEGADSDGFLYTCRVCNAKLRTLEDEDPRQFHDCELVNKLIT